MKFNELDNKFKLSLKRDIFAILLIKLVLILSIYYIWFDHPVKTSEISIEHHLFQYFLFISIPFVTIQLI